jgi:hypothetical protein
MRDVGFKPEKRLCLFCVIASCAQMCMCMCMLVCACVFLCACRGCTWRGAASLLASSDKTSRLVWACTAFFAGHLEQSPARPCNSSPLESATHYFSALHQKQMPHAIPRQAQVTLQFFVRAHAHAHTHTHTRATHTCARTHTHTLTHTHTHTHHREPHQTSCKS